MLPRPQPPCITSAAGPLILLLGQTGAGKSHFINVAANKRIAPVHDEQTSTDLEVRPFILRDPKRPSHSLVLVDAPGFDHLIESDNEILARIIEWLKNSCSSDVLFGGIVYLHDITQDRVGTTYGPSWPIGYLSRPEPAQHLLLTTVKWDRAELVSGPDYNRRENELRRGVWKGIGDGGAKICRFRNTNSSAWEVINTILELQPLELQVLQKELDRIRRAATKPAAPRQKKGIFAKLFSFFR